MNMFRRLRGLTFLLSVIMAVMMLAGCSIKIVPTQYDLKLTSKVKEIEAERGGEMGEIEILIDSSRFDDLSSEENNTFLSYHYYTADGELVDYDGIRTEIELIPARGKKNEVMAFIAPLKAGSYILQVDLVEEGVTWFSVQGMPTLEIPVTVREDAYESYQRTL